MNIRYRQLGEADRTYATDRQAIGFYHTTGGIPEQVVHFSYATGKQVFASCKKQ